jgi:TrpR family trp operon transcriptional repressor
MKKKTLSRKETIRIIREASKKPEVLEALLEHMLTPGEYEELLVRTEILKRLLKGEQQRVIAGDLGLGVATVTRGSREVRRMTPVIKKIILSK